ncbi:ABC transporter ATP-binding protein [Catenulispora rubra]|uniref:ABC transporter ATP-binding protein n=1 Tax=Catenulispora rubra TaxID=280293 RepID=UPI0018921E97|nr:ATP-binding cassette domain-containing protein [Catenulispora rubra]
MAEPALSVHALGKTYGDFTAVESVSFDIQAGGSLALVGESGSGKTTTARMIAGLERATTGSFTVDGAPPARKLAERARQIQMVFQDPYSSLDRRQRVRSCLAEAVQLHSPARGTALQARVEELLDLVGLDSRQADARPGTLSGGQRQRVAIARALAAEPRILILDEAVAALDVSIQAQVLTLLAKLRAAAGVTMLFITHDLAIVPYVCDDVLVMCKGRIVERGTVERVLTDPDAPYTRRLLDAVPRPGWRPKRADALHDVM